MIQHLHLWTSHRSFRLRFLSQFERHHYFQKHPAPQPVLHPDEHRAEKIKNCWLRKIIPFLRYPVYRHQHGDFVNILPIKVHVIKDPKEQPVLVLIFHESNYSGMLWLNFICRIRDNLILIFLTNVMFYFCPMLYSCRPTAVPSQGLLAQ